MRKLLFLLLFLIPLLSFAQYPWVYTTSGYPVSLIHSVPDTIALETLDTDLNVMVYLRGYASGSATGSGWFNAVTSAASEDAENVFDHPDTGVRYVRMVTITSTLTTTGEVTFSTTVCDTNAFNSTDQTDTVAVSGAVLTDKYVITMRGGTLDAEDTMLMVEPVAGGFVIHRPASGLSGLKYTWLRLN